MIMQIQFKKHVRIICDLEVGDSVIVKGWGPLVDGPHIIEDIKFTIGSESGFSVKLNGYERYLDSNWIYKK